MTRFNLENHIYFVTSKTKNNIPIFLNPNNAEIFIKTLFDCRDRYGFLLLGFVVMPDHFHILIMPKEGYKISSEVQKIKSLFAYKMREIGIKGSLWQKSFYDFIGYSEEKCREKLNYIHANPIRKGLVKDLRDYRFSSINYSEKLDVID
ncbi:MAG: REP-associated tyrosine transposase [Thermodesulfobacteriota bacterium]